MTELSAQQWAQVEDLFAEAFDLPAAEQQLFVCRKADDAVVRAEVLSLLGVKESGFDLQGAISSAAAKLCESRDLAELQPGHRIGDYRIEKLLGRGGMGAVYLTHREGREFSQRVAVKVLAAGMHSPHMLERFRQERLILARLEHPNIARLLDGGETADGQPFIAMEYVDGRPLHHACEGMAWEQRISLFLKICGAVAYAHRELVIHRDLKPGNILVTVDGIPKLLDFGIGKLIEEGDMREGLTQAFPGIQMLTPEYASPEQVRNEAAGTGADIYALGAILYELLSGVKAHVFPDMSPAAVWDVICEQPTTKPSAAASRRHPADTRLRRALAGDLDNIILKAMHKDRQRRYLTASELADDIERYQHGYPVLARPDRWGYRLQKFLKRNRMAVAAGAMAAIALASGMVLTIREKQQAERRFQQVRGLANQFLVEVDREMRKTPGTTRAREVMVRTALASLDGLANEAKGDPGILSDLAEAYEKAAQVQGVPGYQNLGQVPEALASQRKSVDLFRQVFRANPSDEILRRRFSDQLSNHGRVLMLEGDFAAAGKVLEEGMRLLEGRTGMDDVVVASYNITHLGRTLALQGKHDESERLLRKSLAQLRPFGDKARAARYQVESDLAEELRLNGFPEQSEAMQMPLLAVRRDIYRRQSQDTIRMRRLGQALHAAGLLYAGGKEPGIAKPELAWSLLEESRGMFARMRDADSNNLSGPVELAVADMELARVLPPGKRALELLKEAHALLGTVPVRSALMPSLRAKALALQAASLRVLGRVADAESVLASAGRTGEEWFAHLVATARWEEAAAAGEQLLTGNGDLPDTLRQSRIRAQLQLVYGNLGKGDRAAEHLRWRRQAWASWDARRAGNAQIQAELRALD
ncbi:MAG TPA: serine/threonine-protein kinase [Bryobacteraceae bacterium]|nr:serine/threonine-protein kinase [Bryobacteraceae bacterium]